MPGLKSDPREFTSTIRSLQCTISFIQKMESQFLAESALPRVFELFIQLPGLLNKRKFSVWHSLSSSYVQKLGIRPSLESYCEKSTASEGKIWLPTSDRTCPCSSRSSSANRTPRKASPEKQFSAAIDSPVPRQPTEVPLFPAPTAVIASDERKKKDAAPSKSSV